MGCAQCAAEGHGKSTGDGRADNAAGQNAQRVGCCIGNSALRHEAQTHDVVHDAVAALVRRPLAGAEGGGQGDGDGRNHAAHHDGGHHLVVAGGKGGGAKDVGCLVDRAAHIHTHHTGHDSTQQHLGAAAQCVQPVGHGGVDHAHDRVHGAHHRTYDQDAAQRVDEHRPNTVQAGGQLFGDLFEELHNVARCKTGQQRCKEAAGDAGGAACGKVGKVGAVHSQHAAGKTYSQARTVGDGHGNEACQNGQHVAEGCAAHRLEEGGDGGVHAEVCGVDAVIVQQEGQRDHDAAAHHEGQHVGNAVHQVLVQAAAEAVLGGAVILGCCAALGVVHGHLAVGDLFDQLLRLVDAVIYAGKQHRLAVKAGGVHLFFRCHDDAVTGGDLSAGQDILCAVRAVGLHLGGQTQLVTGLGQRLGGHVGVGDAVDAGSHSQNAVAVLRDSLLGKAFCAELCFLLRVDALQELLGGLGGFKLFHKVLVHQHLHHAGQHINMQAAVFRCGNGKQQVGGAVILGVVLHRGAQPQGGQTGAGDYIGLGVGHGDAVVHIGRALGLAGVECLFVGLLISDVAMGSLQFHQTAQDLLLRLQRLVQRNGLCGK